MHRVAPANAKDQIGIGKSSQSKQRTWNDFFRKYFLEGQKLDESVQDRGELDYANLSFHKRYRKYIAILLPFTFFQLCWWSLAIRYNLFRLYPTRYEMAITMIFGAFVAGSTSEGGGSIAFPVMTLLLHISPIVARDFSLMIQSTDALFRWHSIIFSSLGAAFSIILGLHFLDDLFSAPQKKMIFVSIWFAFAMSLLILNLQHKRITYDSIPQFNWWKGLVLFGTGMFGGLLTAFTGSGVDICSFSMLTLLFRVTEKVATPTSVILMCLNTWVGFYWRQLIMTDVSDLAWEYFAVSVPVVVIFSPLGAFISSHLHRQVLAVFVYVLETAAVIGFLITRPPLTLVLAGLIIILVGSLLFYCVSYAGKRLSDQVESRQMNIHDVSTSSPQHESMVSSAYDLSA